MQRQSIIQQSLRLTFPQFCDKQRLIDYYVSFDFPEKQMKMVGWWQKVIEFIIQNQQKIYITYQELVSYVTFYNLKPTPLQAIILFLAKRDVFVPENQMQSKIAAQKEKNQQGKSWISSFLPFLSKQEKQKAMFTFSPGEKIFSKKIKEFKKQEIKNMLPQLFTDHIRSMDEFKMIKVLQSKCGLDQASVQELLKELQLQQTISIRQKGQKTFILYSLNTKDLTSNEWTQLQSMKFCLREEILKFQSMMGRQEEKAIKLKAKAKEQAANMNKNSAKVTLKQYLERQRKIANISTRKNVLQNQLTQLEYNEMNKSTLLLLEESQKVYQQTMIDSNKLDEIMQKNAEMTENTKQINEKFEHMGKDESQEDVESMLQALSREVQVQKKTMIDKREKKVEITHQHEPMDIQSTTQQQYN